MSSIKRVIFLGVTLPDLKLLVTMSRSRRGDVGKKSQRLILVPMTKVMADKVFFKNQNPNIFMICMMTLLTTRQNPNPTGIRAK